MNILTKIIDNNCMLIQQDKKGKAFICGSDTYIEESPLVLKTPEDFWRIQYRRPEQYLLYAHDRKWSIEDSKKYLNSLLSWADALRDSNILDITRYKIETNLQYPRSVYCEGNRKSNLVCFNEFNCTNCNDIILSDKCTFCPVGYRCPACNSIEKENICYMHQAESIAALLISQDLNSDLIGWIIQVMIPYSWAKLFGDDIYKRVQRIRNVNAFNIYQVSDLLFTIKVKVKVNDPLFMDIKDFLTLTPLIVNNEDDGINFNVDKGTLNYIKHKFNNPNIIKSNISIQENVYLEPTSVKDISFGSKNMKSYVDIVDVGGPELGDPRNIYTYSILHTMKDYINSNTKNVLDIGCGRGTTSVYAKKCGANKVTAVDIDSDCIKKTTEMANFSLSQEELYGWNIIEDDIFKSADVYNSQYDVIIGNLAYPIQKELLPKISTILSDGGIYIAGGTHIMIEDKLLSIECNLEVLEIKYFYYSTIIIFQKRKEIKQW